MSLSVTEKNFWVAELQKALSEKQSQLLNDNGTPDLLDDLKIQAAEALLEDKGLTETYLVVQALKQEKDLLDKEYEEAKYKLADALGLYRYHDITLEMLADQKRSCTPYLLGLLEKDEVGQRWLELEKQKQSIERSIMFATSATGLRNFVRTFCESIGLDLITD